MSTLIVRRAYFGAGAIALAFSLAVLALVALAGPRETAAAPAKPVAVTLNGTGAYLGGAYADPVHGEECPIQIMVDPGGPTREPMAYLSLQLYVWDPEYYDPYWCMGKDGDGKDGNGDEPCPPPPPEVELGGCAYVGTLWQEELPSGAFTQLGQTYTLETTAAVYPWRECEKEGCPEEEPKPDPTLVPIAVTWQRTSAWESTRSGTDAYRGLYYDQEIVRRTSGSWSDFSASATGTFRGSEVLTSGGEPWESRGASLTTYHNTTVCRVPAELSELCGFNSGR